MRGERKLAKAVHWSRTNRNFSKNLVRPACHGKWISETEEETCTYSLPEITCAQCLQAFIKVREKEISQAREYLRFAT